ncbi:MAG: S-adenosyl-l-methionine hydroxide adenosyltransferase family protein [Thaumarchaeota archaeon]|nr:S-adenosyl-l-methionine hydroxide adenosyltransferase family protein [Nitrososphaerota archaeon]
MKPIISLLTDYGLKDPYVAQVKAVILSYCVDAVIIDLTHEISAFNELQAAFLLKVSAPHMPKGTIHVCIVDPGVGTERRGIIIKTRRGDVFIGPDTGFMIPAAEELGIERVCLIDESRLPPRFSETFHGRDVFAHVAGKIASGEKIEEIGGEISDFARLELPEPMISGEKIGAVAVHVDRFGNVITNVKPKLFSARFGDQVVIKHKDVEIKCKYVKSYAHVPLGEPLITIGGTGYIEISVNRGNAAEKFGIVPGSKLTFIKSEREIL